MMAGPLSEGKRPGLHAFVLWYVVTTSLCQAAVTGSASGERHLTEVTDPPPPSTSQPSTSQPSSAAEVPDLPGNWAQVCTRSENFVTWNFTTLSSEDVHQMTQISCRLNHGEDLFFTDFRQWNSIVRSHAKTAIKIVCTEKYGGAIHLPWPMKAENLVYLEVHGCKVQDYYAEYFDDRVTLIPDQLRVLDLKHCLIVTDILELFDISENILNSSREVECGPLSVERLTFSDVRFQIDLMDYGELNLAATSDGDYEGETFNEKMWSDSRRLKHQCDFKHLRYMDESMFEGMSGRHLFSLQAKAFYPELQFYNLSHIGFNSIPLQLQEWRVTMEKMSYLDLSHNDIDEIDFSDSGFASNGIGTIDLQYNSIRQLRKSDLDTLHRMDTATINIRHNLLNCSCDMLQDFHQYLKSPHLGRYEYLRDLRCGWPEKHKGRRASELSEVEVNCTEGLLALAGGLICFVLVLIVALIILWRYRREVTILVYTRLNILIPCQTTDGGEDKEFDAFISYSSRDDDWVLRTLVDKLEASDNGVHPFKLCVHHRDFEIGAAIADNVVRSVESSRHTIMVLSRNYIQSEWCIYEFRTAMHQSIIERRKHLILILLEDVPRAELDPDLRKCLETFTYIQVNESLFWDKLRYTLTVRSKRKSLARSPSSRAQPSEKDCLKPKQPSNNNVV